MIVGKKYMEQADLRELVAFFAYLFQGKTKEGKAQWTILRLKREKQKYQSKGLPLPKSLQGNWEERVWKKIVGTEYQPEKVSVVKKEDITIETKSESSQAHVQKMEQEPRPTGIDPAARDFYEWAFNWREEKEEGIIPLVNRVKR